MKTISPSATESILAAHRPTTFESCSLSEESFWRERLTGKSVLPLALAILVGLTLMRGVAHLGPDGRSWLAPLGFIVMAITPIVLMTRSGRAKVGFFKPSSRFAFPASLALGSSAAVICQLVGVMLFGFGDDHWFVSVANTYRENAVPGMSLVVLHLVFTIPAVIFSPIGEESFFRGVLQQAFESRVGRASAMLAQAVLFGIIHLLHHGLWRTEGELTARPWSGLVWVLLMASTAVLFTMIRRRWGSLYPAIAAHAAFNLTMNVIIFAVLWG